MGAIHMQIYISNAKLQTAIEYIHIAISRIVFIEHSQTLAFMQRYNKYSCQRH